MLYPCLLGWYSFREEKRRALREKKGKKSGTGKIQNGD